MPTPPKNDPLNTECLEHYRALVECVGIKRFSQEISLGTRQINRILSGTQPNPIQRLIVSLQAATPEVGDRVLDFICQEMGGHFVRMQSFNESSLNAVKECAEAIAAISDGHISDHDFIEIREAISALAALSLNNRSDQNGNQNVEPSE